MKYNAVIEAKQVEAAATEPVTLAEAKQWCKIELDITEENTLLTQLITAARKQLEGYLCISLVDKTVTAVFRNELGNIELPYGPVKSITSVTDVDGNAPALWKYLCRLFVRIKVHPLRIKMCCR